MLHWESFRSQLEDIVAASQALGARDTRLEVAPPAVMPDVAAVERALGRSIPPALREAVLHFSCRVEVFWFLPEGAVPPFPEISHGVCSWDLAALPSLDAGRRRWLDMHGASAPGARTWQHAMPFATVGNGDVLAIDTASEPQAVVYVSCNGGATHGWRLGDDFQDYLRRSSLLAFAGQEYWQVEPFLISPATGLITDSANAREWRRWFGLPEPLSGSEAKSGPRRSPAR